MESTAPSASAGQMMKNFYPQWTAENMARHRVPLSTQLPRNAEEVGFTEFVLSSNWILRPEGLKELYKKIREEVSAPEITYEFHIGCFRVRCEIGREEQIVTLFKRSMDEIVHSELAKVPEEKRHTLYWAEAGDKIRHISEWRVAPIDEKENEAYEAFSYPSDIMVMPFRGTWRVSQKSTERGVTIRKLFARLDPVAILAESSDCTVAKGSDGLSLHFGAHSEDNIMEAKNKMDNLLKYYELPSGIGCQQANVLYTEGEQGIAELRYLSQLNRRYVTSVFLDPMKFQLANDYGKIFAKGSFVRLVPYSKSPETNRETLSVVFSPATTQDQACKAFQPFHAWEFVAKERDNIQGIWSLPQQLMGRAPDSRKQVNPQAAPHVLEWTNTLPSPGEYLCNNSTDGASSDGRAISALSNPSANDSLPSQVMQRTQVLRGSAYEERGTGTSFFKQWNDGGKEKPSSQKGGVDYIGTANLASSQLFGQPTIGAGQQHFQTNAMKPGACNNQAPVYQSRSSIALSPATTNASSQVEKEPEDLLSFSPVKPQLSMKPLVPTRQVTSGEQKSRKYHSTMNQKSGSRATQRVRLDDAQHLGQFTSAAKTKEVSQSAQLSSRKSNFTGDSVRDNPDLLSHVGRNPDLSIMTRVYGLMSEILEPLRLFQGRVTLRADIGRFILTNIDWHHISMPNSGQYRGKSIEAMGKSLENHTDLRDLLFTKIVTLRGGDANYIRNLNEIGNESSKMWLPKQRGVFYEFWCMTKGESGRKHYFFLNIDAEDFTYNLRIQDTKASRVSVHCMKRLYDFQLVVESSHSIEEICGNFAREVIASLRVKPQVGGPPIISFTNPKNWGVETKTVRIRHVATYNNPEGSCALDITQVQSMKLQGLGKGNHWHLEYVPDLIGKPKHGFFPLWFEASIRSTKADEAFAENEDLGFAEEASWTPDMLISSGAFDDLVKSVTGVVKQMDGVGYWCDNQQDSMKHGEPPKTEADVRREAQVEGPVISYW